MAAAAAAGGNSSAVKLSMSKLDLILSRPPAPFRDEKEEEGLAAFDLIYRYLPNVRKWFQLQATSTGSPTLDENQFLLHFRKLTTFKDHEILDIFDTFDKDDSGRIGFDEFFLILTLLAARECGRTTQFLHIHGKQLFDTIAKGSQQLTFERFARLGFVIGVPEHAILQRLKEFGVGVFDTMGFEDFNQYYFAIFDDLDKGTFDAKSPLTSISTSELDVAKANEKCTIS